MVTGAGPHGGSLDAKRIPVAFRDIAEVHSTVALFLIGLVLAMLFALHEGRAPAKSQRWARLLFELLVLQGFLGYPQYLLHDNRVDRRAPPRGRDRRLVRRGELLPRAARARGGAALSPR